MEDELVGDLIVWSIYFFIALIMGYMIWRWSVNGKRAENNQCPRCGVSLDGIETIVVRVGNGGASYADHIMCLDCASITRRGPRWLWVAVIMTIIGVFLSAAFME